MKKKRTERQPAPGPLVFVTHVPTRLDPISGKPRPSVNLDAAREFGRVESMLPPGALNHDALQGDIEAVRTASLLVGRDDFFLPLGDVVLTAVAMNAIAQLHGHVNLLRWEKHKRVYRQVQVQL